MAANARYEPAPQRDSFEDQQFTQAPPSYQATAEPAPRTENDNLPDDFKVRIIHVHTLANTEMLTIAYSSAAACRKALSTSGCSSCARSTLSCESSDLSTPE